MDGYQEALKLLPPEIVGVFRAYHGQAEELRLRRGQAPHIYDGCRELALDHVPLTELDLRRARLCIRRQRLCAAVTYAPVV